MILLTYTWKLCVCGSGLGMLWVRDFSHCCSRLSCLRGLRASGYSLVLARFSAFLRRLAIISMPRFGICAEERRKFLERAELSSLLRL